MFQQISLLRDARLLVLHQRFSERRHDLGKNPENGLIILDSEDMGESA